MGVFSNLTDKYNEKLFLFGLCLMIVSFPFSLALNSISIGVILLPFVLDYNNYKKNFQLYISQRRNIFLLLLFISLCISLAYTQNINIGAEKVIGYLPFIALPLAMTKLNSLSIKQIKILIKLHVIICVVASLICLILATIKSGLLNGTYKDQVAPNLYTAYFVHRFTYHQLSETINLHAVYFSLFIAVALIFCAVEINNAKRNWQIILVMVMCFLGIVLFLLKSVVINFAFYSFLLIFLFFHFTFQKPIQHIAYYSIFLIATFISIYLYILKEVGSFAQNTYLFEDPNWNKKILIALVFSLLLAILSSNFKLVFIKKYLLILFAFIAICITVIAIISYPKRTQELYSKKEKVNGVNNINARADSWVAAWMIIKEHPLSGVGIGDTDAKMIEKYRSINFETGAQNHFNVHNQYLEFWIGSGIIAFICFVLLLLNESYYALLNKNVVLLGLLYIFLIFCFTESVMNRQVGRMFFLLFLCLLSYNQKLKPGRQKYHDPN